jgi:hypothetical protein
MINKISLPNITSIFFATDEAGMYNNILERFDGTTQKTIRSLHTTRGGIGGRRRTIRNPRCDFSNSLIICVGKVGINEKSIDDCLNVAKKANKKLRKNNTVIVFVRGCEDNSTIFNDNVLDLSNVKAVPDYTVIDANGFNVLCVGGGISLNRSWKMKHLDTLPIYETYDKNEATFYNEGAMLEIEKSDIDINLIVTYDSPSFTCPSHILSDAYTGWSNADETLCDDIIKNKAVMDKLYTSISKKKPNSLRYWPIRANMARSFCGNGINFSSITYSTEPNYFCATQNAEIFNNLKATSYNDHPIISGNIADVETLQFDDPFNIGRPLDELERPLDELIMPVEPQAIVADVGLADGHAVLDADQNVAF